MVKRNRERNKWKSTEEFGSGMLDDTMNALAEQGIASPKTEILYDIRVPNTEEMDKKKRDILIEQVCSRAAKKICKELQNRWDRYGFGNYFFALSLHEDYHCVVLRMEGKDKVSWIDQEGQKEKKKEKVATDSFIAGEMTSFFPQSYSPKLSTLWQFYPMHPNEPLEDQIKGLKALKGAYMHILSFEAPAGVDTEI